MTPKQSGLLQRFFIMAGFVFALTALPAAATQAATAKEAQKPYFIPKVEKHLIKSKFIDQTFEIHVQVPVSKKDGSEKFPVLFLTDVNSQLDTGLIHFMQISGETRRFITVGIGYPVDHVLGADNLRARDLTPTVAERPEHNMPIEGVAPVLTEKKLGAAPEFLRFIREQLMPFINSHYNTIPQEATYSGHSFGGLFGLYVLFNQPDTFKNYMIGSPSIWWDNKLPLKWAENYIKSKKPLNAKVYLATGGREEIMGGVKHGMTNNVYTLESMLVNAKVPGLDLKTEIFPQEEHISAVYMIHSRGLRYVFGRGCMIYVPGDCDQNP